jgi:hypothetical protein
MNAMRLLLALSLLWVGVTPPTPALVVMDTESVTMALRYGMMNQHKGLATLLGSNWMEGPDGVLLNIYTPFMLLATKAARGGHSSEPTEEDLAKARKQCNRMIHGFTDANAPQRVKFAVSFLGDSPTFAVKTTAVLRGVTHGREVLLKPTLQYRQPSSTVKPSEADPSRYEAVNSYYFTLSDVAQFDQYEFVLTLPSGQTVPFAINNQSIY